MPTASVSVLSRSLASPLDSTLHFASRSSRRSGHVHAAASHAARHMFTETSEGRWLVDTGAPSTFGSSGSITWRGTRRAVPDRFGPVELGQVQSHISTPIAGLIGVDLLNDGALHSFLRHPSGTRGHDAREHVEATTNLLSAATRQRAELMKPNATTGPETTFVCPAAARPSSTSAASAASRSMP